MSVPNFGSYVIFCDGANVCHGGGHTYYKYQFLISWKFNIISIYGLMCTGLMVNNVIELTNMNVQEMHCFAV